MYKYFSLSSDYGEPHLLGRAVTAAVKADIPLEVKSYEHWGYYRRAMKQAKGGVIFSTHGSGKDKSDFEPPQWEFSSLRDDENGQPMWRTIEANFSEEEPFGADLLIVLACHANEHDWERYVREGSFAIVSSGVVTAGQCAAALEGFWKAAPDLRALPMTKAAIETAWGDTTAFEVRAGQARTLHD